MLKLKEVVDRQRDELRAKVQEITTISKEVEAVRRHKPHHMRIPSPVHTDALSFNVTSSCVAAHNSKCEGISSVQCCSYLPQRLFL